VQQSVAAEQLLPSGRQQTPWPVPGVTVQGRPGQQSAALRQSAPPGEQQLEPLQLPLQQSAFAPHWA
jgi:hypothetical protein